MLWQVNIQAPHLSEGRPLLSGSCTPQHARHRDISGIRGRVPETRLISYRCSEEGCPWCINPCCHASTAACVRSSKCSLLRILLTCFLTVFSLIVQASARSEERRVGKECRSRWS